MALSVVINLRCKESTTLEGGFKKNINSNRIVIKKSLLKNQQMLNWVRKDAQLPC